MFFIYVCVVCSPPKPFGSINPSSLSPRLADFDIDPDVAPPLPEAAEVQPEDGAVARRGAGRKARPDVPPLPLPPGQHQDVLGDARDCSAGM